MTMKRRNFITGVAAVAAVGATSALPVSAVSNGTYDSWKQRERELNTFTQEDTLEQRIEKLNALMGTSYVLHLDNAPKAVKEEYPKLLTEFKQHPVDHFVQPVDHFTDYRKDGWWVSLEHGGRPATGTMTIHDMFAWTAEVALGYRMAKAQAA